MPLEYTESYRAFFSVFKLEAKQNVLDTEAEASVENPGNMLIEVSEQDWILLVQYLSAQKMCRPLPMICKPHLCSCYMFWEYQKAQMYHMPEILTAVRSKHSLPSSNNCCPGRNRRKRLTDHLHFSYSCDYSSCGVCTPYQTAIMTAEVDIILVLRLGIHSCLLTTSIPLPFPQNQVETAQQWI